MATVKDIFDCIDSFAPFSTQEDFDNAGFLVGRASAEVKTVLVALDITEKTIREAAELGAQLIVSHHPVIFQPIRSVTDGSVTGRLVLSLAEMGVAAVCAHTDLDAAPDGVNDALARALGLSDVRLLSQSGTDGQGRPYGIGRIGLAEGRMSAEAYAAFVKERLNASGVRVEDAGRPVRLVAVGGGACGSMLEDAVKAGCDTFVTADVKYNVFLEAADMGINLMDAGHFPTEDVVCQPLAARLRDAFPDLRVIKSAVHREIFTTV